MSWSVCEDKRGTGIRMGSPMRRQASNGLVLVAVLLQYKRRIIEDSAGGGVDR